MLSSSSTPRAWSFQVTDMNPLMRAQTHTLGAVCQLTNYLSAQEFREIRERVCAGRLGSILQHHQEPATPPPRLDLTLSLSGDVTVIVFHSRKRNVQKIKEKSKHNWCLSDSAVTQTVRLQGKSNSYLHSTTHTVTIKVLHICWNFSWCEVFQLLNLVKSVCDI